MISLCEACRRICFVKWYVLAFMSTHEISEQANQEGSTWYFSAMLFSHDLLESIANYYKKLKDQRCFIEILDFLSLKSLKKIKCLVYNTWAIEVLM